MEKTVTKEEFVCDFCQTESSYEKCLGCGKDVCWKCRKTAGIDFKHSVCMSGSGDGFFCHSCLIDPPKHILPKFHAYLKIYYLRREMEAWSKHFEIRSQEAERELKTII